MEPRRDLRAPLRSEGQRPDHFDPRRDRELRERTQRRSREREQHQAADRGRVLHASTASSAPASAPYQCSASSTGPISCPAIASDGSTRKAVGAITSPKHSQAPIQLPSSSQRAARSAKARVARGARGHRAQSIATKDARAARAPRRDPASITRRRDLVAAHLGDARGAERAAQHLDPRVDERVREADRERAAERLRVRGPQCAHGRRRAARLAARERAQPEVARELPDVEGGIAHVRDLGVEQLRAARRDEHVRRLHVGVDERPRALEVARVGGVDAPHQLAAPTRAPARAGAARARAGNRSAGTAARRCARRAGGASPRSRSALASAGSRVPAWTAPRKAPSTAAAGDASAPRASQASSGSAPPRSSSTSAMRCASKWCTRGQTPSRSKGATLAYQRASTLDPAGRDAILGESLERRSRLLDDERALARARAHAPDPVDVSVAGALDDRRLRRGREAPARRGRRVARPR